MTDTTRTTPPPPEAKSTTGLLSEAMSHVSGLVRKEVDLARAEMNENLHKAMAGVGMIVGAIVLLLTALNVLAAALVDGLAALGIDAGWAALIVGIAFAIIAAILLKSGTSTLKGSSLAPTRTAKNVQRDAHAVKETVNNG
jgi:hypothetical protein